MDVLLTNDDGIRAHGIRALYAALTARNITVHVVAPMHQQSAVGHALTIFEPVRAVPYEDGDYHGMGVYGTPTDCVKLALGELLPHKPDLVMSGINLGGNVGPDILYSGTVAAATEACHEGLPTMAVSIDDHKAHDVSSQAEHAISLAQSIDWSKVPSRRVINVNYPACPVSQTKGIRICPQTTAVWKNVYREYLDPRGNPYWWLEGDIPLADIEPDSDKDLLNRGYITITPLRFNFTDDPCIPILESMLFND